MNPTEYVTPITIIGAGSWGTALAILLGRECRHVKLWPRRREQAEAIAKARENSLYLPGVALTDSIEIVPDIADAVKDSELILLAVPAKGMKVITKELKSVVTADQSLLSAAKGLEPDTGKRMYGNIRLGSGGLTVTTETGDVTIGDYSTPGDDGSA